MITQNKLALNTTPISGGLNTKWVAAFSLRFAAIILFMAMFDNSYAQASFPPVTINLNYPQYQRLRLDGGYQYVDDVGMRGVIIYRLDESTYIAYERLCSFEDDAIVSVDGSGLFMKGCQSTYDFSDGRPSGGPAFRPLLRYRTSLTGNTLVITDEIVY
jgi:nitrite reductase/ring-hydroxylating ferredoxin subunit